MSKCGYVDTTITQIVSFMKVKGTMKTSRAHTQEFRLYGSWQVQRFFIIILTEVGSMSLDFLFFIILTTLIGATRSCIQILMFVGR